MCEMGEINFLNWLVTFIRSPYETNKKWNSSREARQILKFAYFNNKRQRTNCSKSNEIERDGTLVFTKLKRTD